MSLNYHKRVDFRALDVFVDAVKNAPRDELKRAVNTASEMSKDLAISASDRPIWKRLATLLRAELKGYAKNPHKRPAHEKGFIIEDKSPKGCAYVHKQIQGYLEHARPGAIYECDVCHEQFKKAPGKNPENRTRKIGGVVYEVMFTGDGWRVMRIDVSGVGHTEFNAGPGDAGREAALKHLKGMKVSRKKNPEIETRELSLYADNLGPSSQGIELEVYTIRKQFLANVKLNNKRVWTKKRLRNLTNHAAHRAARAYSQVFGQGAYDWKSIFNDADLNRTGKYLYDSWLEEAEAKYKPNPISSGDPSAYDGKGKHILFVFDKTGPIQFIAKHGKAWKLVSQKTRAHEFATNTAASDLSSRVNLKKGRHIGIMKASLPKSFAGKIVRTTRGIIWGKA